ncbi:hypothetical protein [Spirulina subsalsa]|uniref:hypothetical protein n=1 Tax=Spirulina subsalsa TaxID=54311 RepID=UPI00030CBF15|nr:hypothetical protein [Spirulina subsalsa]
MNTLAQEILKNFDELPKTEQQAILLRRRFAIAAEILKRVINFDFTPLTNEDLVLNAEALFLALDEQEADYQ